MQLFEVFLWPKWAPFGVPTLIPSHECIHAVSAFAAVEKAMRARKLSVVGHAVAEIVRGGSLLYYRAYGVRLSGIRSSKKLEMGYGETLL